MGYIILALLGGFLIGLAVEKELLKKSEREEKEFWIKEKQMWKEIINDKDNYINFSYVGQKN